MIYFIIFLVLLIFSLFELSNLRKIMIVNTISADYICFLFCAILMFFVSAFRYKTGRDWNGYMLFFDNCLSKKVSNVEIGFVMLNRIIKITVDNFFVLQLIINFFCSFVIFRHFYNKSNYPIFTLLLYFLNYYFTTDMAQTRQYIAMAIIITGLDFCENKKIFLWCIVIILAMQFHVSAVVAFPLYFTNKKRITRFTALLIVFVSIFLMFFGLNLIKNVLLLVVKFPLVSQRLKDLVYIYIQNGIYGKKNQFSSGLGVIVKYIFIFFIVYLYYKNKYDRKNDAFLLNFLIGVLLIAIGRNISVLNRLSNYYFICGTGLCSYNLLIESKSFFKRLNFIRISICCSWILFVTFSFISVWFVVPKGEKHSLNMDYLPYYSFFLEK